MEVPKEKQTELEKKAHALVTQAKSFTIDSPATYERAVKGIDAAKAFQAEVKAVWDPVCDAANKAHNAATAGRADQMAPFLEAEKILKGLCSDYDRAQAKIAREEAEKKAREEADRKLEEAAKLAAEGKGAEAEAMVEEAAIEETHVVVPETPKPQGLSYIDNWKAVIDDPQAVPREYCIPDQAALNKLAKANKGENAPAGVKFVNDRITRRM